MCLFSWSFGLEDSSFFSVMCWDKQTGIQMPFVVLRSDGGVVSTVRKCLSPGNMLCSMCAVTLSHVWGNFPFLPNPQPIPSTFSLLSYPLS